MPRNVQVTTRDGGQLDVYVSAPEREDRLPAIVIAHEIFGVNASIRETADWYASQGFLVGVPDIFWRQQPGVQLNPASEDDRNLGIKLLKGLDESAAVADIAATAQHLRSDARCNGSVGVVGFCMGGKLAYLAATAGAYPAVSYYGVGIDAVLDRAGELKAPVLMHIPEQDALCPPDAQLRIKSALETNEHVRIISHPDAGHAFARRNSPAFVASAAGLADAETVSFLRTRLAS